jgi:hypothetical protein
MDALAPGSPHFPTSLSSRGLSFQPGSDVLWRGQQWYHVCLVSATYDNDDRRVLIRSWSGATSSKFRRDLKQQKTRSPLASGEKNTHLAGKLTNR